MHLTSSRHGTVVAYLALIIGLTGTAGAATGGYLVLGRSNTASTTTSLTNSGGTALSLSSKAGTAPLAVNSSVKVSRLNADSIDGLDSAAFQRRVTGSCPDGQAVKGVNSNGTVTCTPLAPPAPGQPAQFTDKGWSISDLQIIQGSSGDWDGRARITNGNSGTRTGTFTVTLFRDGHVIATLQGSVSSAASGSTYTVDLFSFDAWSDGAYTTTFQTDSSY